MKTLYLTQSSENILIDDENKTANRLRKRLERYEIRDIYYIDEDMTVVYGYGEDQETLEAKKDDVLLLFYDRKCYEHKAILIQNENFKNNILAKLAQDQKEKEEWAAKNKSLSNRGEACDK